MNDIPDKMKSYVRHRDNVCRLCRRPLHGTEGYIVPIFGRYNQIPPYLKVADTYHNIHPFNLIRVCPTCYVLQTNGIATGMKESMVRLNKELECMYPIDHLKDVIENEK